jgi:hypothetical protein
MDFRLDASLRQASTPLMLCIGTQCFHFLLSNMAGTGAWCSVVGCGCTQGYVKRLSCPDNDAVVRMT